MDTHTQLTLIGYITAMLITGRAIHHYDTHQDEHQPIPGLHLFCLSLMWPIVAAVAATFAIIVAFIWAATGTKPWK